MRAWKLQDLFDDVHKTLPKAKKHVSLIHVCTNCGWRTPELAPLSVMNNESPLKPPITFEIKDKGLCDECNKKCWKTAVELCNERT